MASKLCGTCGTNVKELPSVEYLRERLSYDAETGVFTWKWSPSIPRSRNVLNAGKVAGTVSKKNGYRTITILRVPYLAHRLAWVMSTGEDPAVGIDHRNGNRDDNRIENLRPATQKQNAWNRASAHDGVKAVFTERGRYRVRPMLNGEKHNLGVFDTEAQANAALATFAREAHGEFLHDSVAEVPLIPFQRNVRKYPAGVQKCRNKFRSRPLVDGRRISLGVYETVEEAREACLAYLAANPSKKVCI